MTKFLILISLCFLTQTFTAAQTIAHQVLSVESGYGAEVSWTIYKDNRGFIWAGPTGRGAVAFDGKRYFQVTDKQGLVGNNVISFLHDRHDRMWFGCQGQGVSVYDGKRFFNFSEEDSIGLTSNNILSMFETVDGSIYLGTYAQGLLKFDGVFLSLVPGSEGGIFYDMLEDEHGVLWLSTRDSGLARLENGKMNYLNDEIGLPRRIILDIEMTPEGQLLICSSAGFFHFDPTVGTVVKDASVGMPQSYDARCCAMTPDGRIYLYTSEGAFCLFDGRATDISYHSNLGYGFTRMVLDQSGAPWASTNGSGMVRIVQNGFTIVSTPDKYIQVTATDSAGNLYLGNRVGVYQYSGKNFESVQPRVTLRDEHSEMSWLIAKDSMTFYMGMKDYGLVKYSAAQDKFEHINTLETYAVTWRDDRYMLMAGIGQLVEFDTKTNAYTEIYPLGYRSLFYAIQSDTAGGIWTGTYDEGYIFHLTPTDTVLYTQEHGLPNGAILSLQQDYLGRIWFLNIDGYFGFFNGTGFTTFAPAIDGEICSFLPDASGNIWFSGRFGIGEVAMTDNRISAVRLFGIHDGVSQELTSNNQGLRMNDNRLVFPKLDNKVYVFDPKAVLKTTEVPKIYLAAIRGRDGEPLDSSWAVSQEGFFQIPQKLVLPYAQNNLTVQVGAVYFSNPDSLLYSYQLVGYDEDWSKPKSDDEIHFTNLPSGSYTLMVKAVHGTTSSEILSFEFEVETPWYKSWIFYAFCVVSGALIIWLLFRWRLRHMRKEQERLEAIIKDRTREVIEEKEIVEEKNRAILDSINYAKRLQNAILPSADKLTKGLKDYFIFYQPKDIVSGDFYWFEEEGDYCYLAVADCTGHGVPGAMVSTVCASALNKSLHELHKKSPAAILDSARDLVIEHFSRGSDEVYDGMDISLLRLNVKTGELVFAGANNPAWVVSRSDQRQLIQFDADKQPVGKHARPLPFTDKQFQTQVGDMIYLASDGFQDQFGGPKGKKFKVANLKTILVEVQGESCDRQLDRLKEAFNAWAKDFEQVDDICVIGLRISAFKG